MAEVAGQAYALEAGDSVKIHRELPHRFINEGTEDAEVLIVRGDVTSTDGTPLEDAVIDIWRTGPDGGYDLWDPRQPAYNFRGKLRTPGGKYEFQTMLPKPYTVPTEGPVGRCPECGMTLHGRVGATAAERAADSRAG